MTSSLSTVSYLDALQRTAPADVLRLSTSMAFAEERKYVELTIPEQKFKSIEIYHLTDVQWGHVCCNRPRFIEYRDFVLARPNRFVIFGGDMIDAATMLSKGTPWDNDGPPIEQVYEFCRAVMPMRHRILGYVGGNHERHTRPTLGRSAGSFIAMILRVPYSDGWQFININYGEWRPFRVHVHHGGGSARTLGAIAQDMDRRSDQAIADWFLFGHLHQAMMFPKRRLEDDRRKMKMVPRKSYVCRSSSFMEFWSSYGEVAGMRITDIDMWRGVIEPNRKFEVTLR